MVASQKLKFCAKSVRVQIPPPKQFFKINKTNFLMFIVTKTEPVLVINRTIEFSHQVLILLLMCSAIETMCGYELEEESKNLGKRLADLLRDTPTTTIILNDEEVRILLNWIDAGCDLTTGNGETNDTLVSIKKYLNDLPTY